MDVERVIVTLTIINFRPFPRLIDALGDVPDRNAPIVAPCHVYFVALERCNSRSEDEVIMGLPSIKVFMACIENLVEVGSQRPIFVDGNWRGKLPLRYR